MSRLRKWAKLFARTPLHPQWLLAGPGKSGRWVGENAKGRVLDIGCADRWIERWLGPGCQYVGLDYPATGQELYGARPDVFADASKLPVCTGSVDTVVLLEVMEHLRYPQDALHEIARVLRPQGRLILSMPFLYPVHDAPHDYQRLTIHGLTRDVEAAGLKVDCVQTTLGSAETAGLIASLALGGMAIQVIGKHRLLAIVMPFFAMSILFVNLFAWIAGRLLPPWEAITAGYRVLAHNAQDESRDVASR